MKKIIIAAHDPNLIIGNNGKLPWYYPEDLKFFKKTTMGHPLLMGRVVFEELSKKPLPGRESYVLTKSKSYDHVTTFSSISEAFENLKNYDKVFIIGGGEVYRQTIDLADRLIITKIHETYEGDTRFPEYRDKIGEVWKEVSKDERDELSFLIYDRIEQ